MLNLARKHCLCLRLKPLCPPSHPSYEASLYLTVCYSVRQKACLCVSVCCLLSVYCVSLSFESESLRDQQMSQRVQLNCV